MKSHLMRAAGLFVALALVATIGCSPPPKKRQFNNILARLNQDLALKGTEFYKAVAPLGSGRPVAGGSARTALDGCKKALTDAQDVFDDTWPPRQSQAGREMHTKYKEFLKAQHQIYDECFTRIVAIVEDNKGFPTPAAKWAAIQPLLQKAETLEKGPYDDLMKAQGEFASKHNFSAQ